MGTVLRISLTFHFDVRPPPAFISTRRRLLLDRGPPARESDQRDEQDVDDGGCGHPVDHALRCETVEDGSYYHHAERRAELLKGRDDSARHSRLLGSDLRQ